MSKSKGNHAPGTTVKGLKTMGHQKSKHTNLSTTAPKKGKGMHHGNKRGY